MSPEAHYSNPAASYVASGISRIRDSAPATLLTHIIHDAEDDEIEHVEHFKYKQDLDRKLTVSSIIGLGFTLMGVPFGLSTTLWIPLVDGGNVTMLYGWIIVGFFSLCVVLSLSEIIAKFPTAGGVYHFSAILSNQKYSLVSSWFTGWFLLIGNWIFAVSVLFLGSQFILSIFGLKNVYYKENTLLVLAVYFVLLSFVGFVNFRFSRYLEIINKVCILWSSASVVLIGILLIIFAHKTNSIGHILTHFDNSRSGWPDPLAFMVGLQSSSFTLTGYGMLFAMTDEVKNPERNMPKGAISAVALSVVLGLFFIFPILIILPELSILLDENPEIMPIDLVFKTATQSYIVSFLLVLLLVGTVLFLGIGALTVASRSTYAFARDGGLPFKNVWVEVDAVEESLIPKNALFLSMGVCAVFSFLALVSSSAFNAFMGASVISLALANGIPIFCLMMNKRRKIKGSAFRLRYFGWIINGISVFWVFISFFVLCLPPVIKNLTWVSMNYASVVFVVLVLIAAVGYKTWGANVFTGPPIDTDYVELHNLEASTRFNTGGPFVVGDDDNDSPTIKSGKGYQEVDGGENESTMNDYESTIHVTEDVPGTKSSHSMELFGGSNNSNDFSASKSIGSEFRAPAGNDSQDMTSSGFSTASGQGASDDDNHKIGASHGDPESFLVSGSQTEPVSASESDAWDALDDLDDFDEFSTVEPTPKHEKSRVQKEPSPVWSGEVIFDQDDK